MASLLVSENIPTILNYFVLGYIHKTLLLTFVHVNIIGVEAILYDESDMVFFIRYNVVLRNRQRQFIP